jgi:hypothetical protein
MIKGSNKDSCLRVKVNALRLSSFLTEDSLFVNSRLHWETSERCENCNKIEYDIDKVIVEERVQYPLFSGLRARYSFDLSSTIKVLFL